MKARWQEHNRKRAISWSAGMWLFVGIPVAVAIALVLSFAFPVAALYGWCVLLPLIVVNLALDAARIRRERLRRMASEPVLPAGVARFPDREPPCE